MTMEKETTQCRIFRNSEKNAIALNEILYLGRYHPWHSGNNPDFDDFSSSILDVKDQRIKEMNHFTDRVQSILSDTEEYVICVIPTHTAGTAPSGIRTIAKELCSHTIIDGTDILSRTLETPKKATSGNRNMESEIKSLTVTDKSIVRDRQVLLMDDVTTTGTSLKAGKCLLEQAGAKQVVMLALAKTQQDRSS